ncbi:Reticulocyte-binding protein 2 a-like protein [Daldinia childiae]|uniref:Reticulocyte-binding protein 2 a-like protein n=1 Tax=Daldinia childiae TaxID=326645 RepID=UPI001444ADB9|nr:Reticulocyte-binding protein 2 a-like protein [Daldinia childiae]KAF3069112.1 Reticulocyte-binding protein 2 a-like protein [Daldinia childiae]
MDRISPDDVSLDVPRPTIGVQWGSSTLSLSTLDDPRSSSTQSLLPSPSENDDSGRRKLLVIYIHGFMGNDASFQSFPAHVHKYLKLALSETHTVHSKIYPRYKTYKALDVARDNFSRWLAPHESPTTDVVLVGHSMGGLLAADIALMPSRNQYQMGYFLHRIIGTVNLDAPLLGLHASVVTAGIASLFRPKSDTANLPQVPMPEDESVLSLSNINSANTSIYSDPSSASQSPGPQGIPYGMTFDPNYNPSFVNDVPLRDRGWWRNIVHFVEKHNSEGLLDAVSHHLMSHLEFGSCLMDLNNLKTRYENIRRLEDVDDLKDHGFPHVPPQVRFIQYYTVCNGYPKKPKDPGSNNNSEALETILNTRSAPPAPQISVQGHDHPSSPQDLDAANNNTLLRDSFDGNSESPELQLLAPEPMSEEPQPIPEASTFDEPLKDIKDKVPENDNDTISTTDLTDAVASLSIGLPTIPELPVRPDPPDFSQYTDKDVRKQAEKEAKRIQKDYDKLVKDHDKAIRERQKIYDKRKKKMAQETEKKAKEEQKRRKKEAAAIAASSSSTSDDGPFRSTSSAVAQSEDPDMASPLASPSAQSQGKAKPPKPPKERKFCNVPKVDGVVDPKWVKIFIKDMDQVAAHTSLFFRGDHYEKLVGDVGETIVGWVQHDMTKRAILEME